MKVNRQESFTPITIVLESQAEVDELFALLNHGTLSTVFPNIGDEWKKLSPYKTEGYAEIHNKLDAMLDKARRS